RRPHRPRAGGVRGPRICGDGDVAAHPRRPVVSRSQLLRDGELPELPGDDTGCHILHADMDAFFASVELRTRPELVGKPVIVGGPGAGRRLGSPRQIAELISARVADEQNVPCSVGVATTKFVAKLASSRAKPDGLLVVPRDAVVQFLHPLPIGALWGVGEKTE